jgi:hypothetical protein
MKGNVAFLMKDVVLLAASVYLLKQDVARAALAAEQDRRCEDGQLRVAASELVDAMSHVAR